MTIEEKEDVRINTLFLTSETYRDGSDKRRGFLYEHFKNERKVIFFPNHLGETRSQITKELTPSLSQPSLVKSEKMGETLNME